MAFKLSSFTAFLFLVAAAPTSAEPAMTASGGNLDITIDHGKTFSITCPESCPTCSAGCEGPLVEFTDGQCVPTPTFATRSDITDAVAAAKSELSGKIDGVYTKGEVDAKMMPLTTGLADVYTKSETATKITDMTANLAMSSTVTTLTERVATLEGKEVYTKAEVDNLLSSMRATLESLVADSAKESAVWIGATSPAATTDSTSLTMPSHVTGTADVPIYLSGIALQQFYSPRLANTFECTFTPISGGGAPVMTHGEVHETHVTSGTAEDSTAGSSWTPMTTYDVMCPAPFDLIGEFTISLRYVGRSTAIDVFYDGPDGRDTIMFTQTWSNVFITQQSGGATTLRFTGAGFPLTDEVATTFRCQLDGVSGNKVVLVGSSTTSTEIVCEGDVTQAIEPLSGSTTLSMVASLFIAGTGGDQIPFVSPTATGESVLFSSCLSGFKEGSETGVDCGGMCSQRCERGVECGQDNDCDDDHVCFQGVCDKKILSCKVILDDANLAGENVGSGVYNVRVGQTSIETYCDMETLGGGWTLLSKFYQNANGAFPAATNVAFSQSDKLWTRGGGGVLPTPTKLENSNADGRYAATLDWGAFLEEGKSYHLRQKIWTGQNGERIEHVDTAWPFTFNGVLSQDERPDSTDPAARGNWVLGNKVAITDDVGGWATNTPIYFYLPWTDYTNKHILNGCGGYSFGKGAGSCRDGGYQGSAGIVNTGGFDPQGSAWSPHLPSGNSCLVWGRHGGGVGWCSAHGNAAYFYREA